jgi:methyltransferase (TIGR00027 family)
MRKGFASRTAMWVAALRGIAELDQPAIVRDRLAAELLPQPYRAVVRLAERRPLTSRAVMRWLAGVSHNLSRHMALRTRAIDDAVDREAAAGTKQLVLLGAGLDARAYRLSSLAKSVVFEVDFPATQAHKRAAIGAHPPLAAEVRHVPIDFARDRLDDVLLGAGHRTRDRTTWVWEGVMMYLEREAIEATLDAIARLSASGSCVVATYHDAAFGWESVPLSAMVRAVGEPFRTRLRPDDVRELFVSRGFDVEDDAGTAEWSERYLGQSGYRSGERYVVARRRS